MTNTVNVALAQSHDIDSNGNGIANVSDPVPFFLAGMINLAVYPTNQPANTVAISWDAVPLATNTVLYSTNLVNWQLLSNVYIPTNPFITPSPYPGPVTNIIIFDPKSVPGRFYRVSIYPWLTYPY